MTINEALALMDAVQKRIGSLVQLRNQVSVREDYFEPKKKREPQFSVIQVDRKISELNLWLFQANSAIKQANAVTEIGLDVDVEKLLAPLEEPE